jgi:deazaflavin-dependent oxidoreductase (nitroreductase family)
MPKTAEPGYLYLTTTGRHSGLFREIEIWFTRRDGLYYVIAEYPTSQWVQNVNANSNVVVRVGETRFAATARIIDAAAEPVLHAAVQQLSREKYGWGDGMVVELQPVDGGRTQQK